MDRWQPKKKAPPLGSGAHNRSYYGLARVGGGQLFKIRNDCSQKSSMLGMLAQPLPAKLAFGVKNYPDGLSG